MKTLVFLIILCRLWMNISAQAPQKMSYQSAIRDVEGNQYKVIKIGVQVWMAENLKTTNYNDGTAIPLVTDRTEWEMLSTPGYCWYNNDRSAFGDTYGALYNWYAAGTGKLCPVGWHVPSDAEWNTLITFLGGESVAGGKMKTTGTIEAGNGLWNDPNEGATNSSGFSGLPNGGRFGNDFSSLGFFGYWWSSTADYFPILAWVRSLDHSFTSISRHSGDCIKST